ncbi:MAG: 4Fe-4S binding protein [Clostridiales bacterium]|nr:4Fe-4S binding protein [Clostridiales bacterium]
MAIRIDTTKCNGCGRCKSICPMDAIRIENGKAKANDDCIECSACVDVCPTKAISI